MLQQVSVFLCDVPKRTHQDSTVCGLVLAVNTVFGLGPHQ